MSGAETSSRLLPHARRPAIATAHTSKAEGRPASLEEMPQRTPAATCRPGNILPPLVISRCRNITRRIRRQNQQLMACHRDGSLEPTSLPPRHATRRLMLRKLLPSIARRATLLRPDTPQSKHL